MIKFRKKLKDGVNEEIVSVDEKLVKKNAKPEGKGKKRRRILFKAMFVMSIISIMISVSFSWFTESNHAKVNGVTMSVVDTKDITLTPPKIFGQISPVSGDGQNFFVPLIGEVAIETETEAPSEGDENEEATEKDYVVYGYDKISDTYTNTADNVTADTLTDGLVLNVRVIDFALDMAGAPEVLNLMPGTAITPLVGAPAYLPGAMRVAFLKKTTDGYKTLFIWMPDVTSVKDGEASIEDSYTFVTTGGVKNTVSNINTESGTMTIGEGENAITYVWGPITDGRQIMFDELSGKGEYRCVIWLDGNDRECNSELIGQKFNVSINISPAEAVG